MIGQNGKDNWVCTIRSDRARGMTITVGDDIATADAVLVIALKVLDPAQQTIGATYQTELTDRFVTQVVPAAFFQTLVKVMRMIENDLTTRLRPS